MHGQPGVTTYLFTDIEGSTRLWEQEPKRMRPALARHDALSRAAVEAHGGVLVKTTGDGIHAVFADPLDALQATLRLQLDLNDPRNTHGVALRVRSGLHAGVDERRDNDFFGPVINRAARIMSAAHGGQILLSQAVVSLVNERLPEGVALRSLGAVRLRDLTSPELIYQVMHPQLRRDFPALRSLEATPNNLPQQVTSFIGRETELADVRKLLAQTRVLTLLGVGGLGKTRLSLQVAAEVLDEYPDGVWFIDLAPVADGGRLSSTIARSLGLVEQRGHPIMEKLCEHVAERQMLLVLDNCEHVVSACAGLVTALLGRSARLKILATSREAMGLPGEQTLRVRSLTWPPIDQPDRFATFEAVQLFVDRARLVQPDFTLDAAAGPAVAEICRRLDGIPLAIELAAARTKVCSVGEVRKMLDDRFRLLVGGSRTVAPRQQTLLATIKWSFDLLTPDERELLQRLCVFSGGWTLESAVAVAGADAGQYEVLEQLTHLVDKSLIATHRRERDATRYSMLETVRQYGLETLAAAGAETAAAKRHLEYFVGLAERLQPAFDASGQREALHELAPELDNLVQALRGSERLPGGPDLGLRLVAALEKYWMSLGLLELGYRLTTEALSTRGAALSSPARAHALDVAARLACRLGRHDEGRDRANECLSLARELHDEQTEAGALRSLGVIAVELGDIAQGIALCEQSLRLARKHADRERIAGALSTLGVAHFYLGNFDEAAQIFEESLRITRDQGDDHSVAVAACNLADAYIYRGQLALASPLLLEAIDMSVGSKWTMFKVLDTITGLAAAAQAGSPAARMLGAAEAAGKFVAHKRHSAEARDWKGLANSIRKSMSESDFQVAYDAGHAMSVEQAIAEARAWLQKSASAARHSPS